METINVSLILILVLKLQIKIIVKIMIIMDSIVCGMILMDARDFHVKMQNYVIHLNVHIGKELVMNPLQVLIVDPYQVTFVMQVMVMVNIVL